MQKRKWENSNETKAATEMDQLKEKIKRKRNVFTDQHLLKPQGLQEIKDEFPIYLARKCSLPAVFLLYSICIVDLIVHAGISISWINDALSRMGA